MNNEVRCKQGGNSGLEPGGFELDRVQNSSSKVCPKPDCCVYGVLGIDLTGRLLAPQVVWSLGD